MENDYKLLYKSESFGDIGKLGIKIEVAGNNLPDLEQSEIRMATYKATDIIKDKISYFIKRDLPETHKATEENKKLLDIFPGAIFSEEIENKYCSDYCCKHLPWFIVTTVIGRFEIGWRKNVISIDWTETIGTMNAEELFPNEDVTKGEKSIHAWSMNDAKKYIQNIFAFSSTV